MKISEIILIFMYMLPALIVLDKNRLKLAFFVFIFLMVPIFLKIHIAGFKFLGLAQLICWIASFVFVKFFGLLRK